VLIGVAGVVLAVSASVPWVRVVILGDLSLSELLQLSGHSQSLVWLPVAAGAVIAVVGLTGLDAGWGMRVFGLFAAVVIAAVGGPGVARLVSVVSRSHGLAGIGPGVVFAGSAELLLLVGAAQPRRARAQPASARPLIVAGWVLALTLLIAGSAAILVSLTRQARPSVASPTSTAATQPAEAAAPTPPIAVPETVGPIPFGPGPVAIEPPPAPAPAPAPIVAAEPAPPATASPPPSTFPPAPTVPTAPDPAQFQADVLTVLAWCHSQGASYANTQSIYNASSGTVTCQDNGVNGQTFGPGVFINLPYPAAWPASGFLTIG
jgi:hypothetical protein